MASNREAVKVTPLSNDEDDDGSSSEYESDSPSPPLKAQSETESESESESEARIAPDSTTATQSLAAKRRAEDAADADANVFKRSKETVEADASEKKKSTRFWSEEDEIVILQGMLDYTSRMKVDHVADLSAFQTFIKGNLHFDFSKVQLKDKIWRLKKKYENNKGKAKAFSKSHDQEIYELSKQVWGNGALAIAASKNGKDKVAAGVSVEQRMLMAGKALEGTEEWEKLKPLYMEIYLNTLNINISRTKLVLEHMRSQRRN